MCFSTGETGEAHAKCSSSTCKTCSNELILLSGLSFGVQQAFFISQTFNCEAQFPHAAQTTPRRDVEARSRRTCFWITVSGQTERPPDASFPFGPLLQVARSTLTRAPSDCGEKEHEGSTPGWSHPLQITICTRHLRARSVSLEGKQTGRKWERLGKMRPGCSRLPQLLYTPLKLI